MHALLMLPLLAGLSAGVPAADSIRVATFNASLNRRDAGALIADLGTPGSAQARAVAEIIHLSR